ncbi:MAG TPA: hypothetical protein ENJ82_06050 [Bacteroidetes bacterium]|nr:hypothetical protein [Bacteroidota bacterium]
MEDLFKKFVYTSVGLVSTTVEKMQKTVEKLVDEDKISQDEGKKIVDDLFSTTESKRTEFEGKLKSIIEDVMTRMNFATQSQIKDLEARLAAAEAKLGLDKTEEAAEPAKKKAPAKKAAAAKA